MPMTAVCFFYLQ